MIQHFLEFQAQAQFEPIKSFRLQDDLNPEFWDNFNLDSKIKTELLNLANDYFVFVN